MEVWCRIGDSNTWPPHSSHYNFRCHCLNRTMFVRWTFPSSYQQSWVRCSPSSLYTFSLRNLARDCHFTGFPDFDECSLKGFPMRTQKLIYECDALPTELMRHYFLDNLLLHHTQDFFSIYVTSYARFLLYLRYIRPKISSQKSK